MERLRAAALAILVGLAALGALPRGGVPVWAQAAGCVAAALALVLALLGEERPRPGSAWLAPALLAVAAALQCVPLPGPVVAALAPASWELRAAAPLTAGAAPLTLDLPATMASLAFAVGLACAAAAAAILAARPAARPWLLAAPLAAAVPQAAVGLAALVAEPASRLTGTFVNRNHAAAVLAAGALVALGGLFGASRRRMGWAVLAAACAAAAFLTLSRGGAIALAAGAALLAALARRRVRVRLAVPVLAAAALLAAALAAEAFLSRARDLSPARLLADPKLRSFAGAALVVRDHWLTGAGRGAFRFVAERHRSVPGDSLYAFVENEPLQLAADVGVPLALAVLALLAVAWIRGVRRASTGLEIGAAAALLALAIQNLVDFSLELWGVALPAAVALGALAAPQARGLERGPPRVALSAAAVAAGALAVAALLWAAPRTAEVEGDRLLRLSRGAPLAAVLAEARDVLRRHPADWLPSLVAARAIHERAPGRMREALAWVNRALLAAPTASRPHALAAAILASAGAGGQARLEARLALSGRRYNAVPDDVTELAARIARGLPELLEATPEDAAPRVALAHKLRALGRREEAMALARHEQARLDAGAEAPGDPHLARVDSQARRELPPLLAALSLEAGDARSALRWAGRSDGCAGLLWRARAFDALGDPGWEAALREGLDHCPSARALVEDLVKGLWRRSGPGAALEAFEKLSAEAPGSGWAADAHLLHAELLEARGSPGKGLEQRWLAAQLGPERPGLALDYAARLAASGHRAAAAQALESMIPRAPPEARAPLEARLRELGAR